MPAKGLGVTRPEPAGDPFKIRINEGRTNAATTSTVTAQIEIGLRDNAPLDNAVAHMSLRPTIVLDDNKQRTQSDHLDLISVIVDGDEVDRSPPITLEISKEKTVSVEVESEAFDRDLYADLEVSVVLPGGQSGSQ